MDEHYQELCRLSTKGGKEALSELFALGERLEAEEKYQEATVAFRDAAISYRISAFRNSGHAEDALRRERYLIETLNIFTKWIENHPDGFCKLPYCESEIGYDFIRDTVIGNLDEFDWVMTLLEKRLSELDMVFYSPGGSIQRRVCQFLDIVFNNNENNRLRTYLNDSTVRVFVDTVADTVADRYLKSNKNSSQTD